MITIGDAIHAINPNVSYRRGETVDSIIWANGSPIIDSQLIIDKMAELQAAEPMRLLRLERNRLLQETDWRFRSDLTPSQAWIDYCQALRDLPANSEPQLNENGELTNVTWPEKPE